MKNTHEYEFKLKTPRAKGKIRENIEALVIAVILALIIRAFVFQAFKIPSGSMQDTLLIGDYILVNKFIYGVKIPFTDMTVVPVRSPRPGEIVVFKPPHDDRDFIKRVVAIPGDTIEIQGKQVSINGKPLQEGFTRFTDPSMQPKRDFLRPVTVPEGKLFVMGDNRDESNDSRFWGFADIKAVKGKAFIIYWSWDSDRFGVRWNRLGHLIE